MVVRDIRNRQRGGARGRSRPPATPFQGAGSFQAVRRRSIAPDRQRARWGFSVVYARPPGLLYV